MYEGRVASSPCTATITDLSCFPFGLTFYQSLTLSELQDLTYGGVIIVTWLHKKLAQVEMPHSHREHVWLIHIPLGTFHMCDHPSTPVSCK
jgi:hypothetical protein